MRITRILPILFLLCLPRSAPALVLRALVADVPNGKTVVVVIGPNRKLTVVLKGVDAPDLKQEYGDVAQQHLASLVLNKEVDVEFTELRTESVVGKVTCNRVDIGLQVVRDGVAWYDRNNAHDLGDLERALYTEAEQAARKEQRGLWQDGSPMPPWEWRRARAANYANPFPVAHKTSRESVRALSSEDVVFNRKYAGAATSNSKASGASAKQAAKPASKPLNQPGEDLDFSSYLRQGRVSIVYFYADWCPSCRRLSPVMTAINTQVPDMQVLFMNIGDWNTPITQRYDITYVPYLRIYDKSGALLAEGHAAKDWLLEAVK